MDTVPIYIGTSGWYYDHWENILYPPGLPKGKRFDTYIQEFITVEINATFYRIPSDSMVNGWYSKAPPDFIFSVKANKLITHNRKLKNTTEILNSFLNSISLLKEKLGIILFQLPPSLKQDLSLLEDFLNQLSPTLKYCIEFRHASWEHDKSYEILEKSNVGHVVVSRKGYPYTETHTGADYRKG